MDVMFFEIILSKQMQTFIRLLWGERGPKLHSNHVQGTSWEWKNITQVGRTNLSIVIPPKWVWGMPGACHPTMPSGATACPRIWDGCLAVKRGCHGGIKIIHSCRPNYDSARCTLVMGRRQLPLCHIESSRHKSRCIGCDFRFQRGRVSRQNTLPLVFGSLLTTALECIGQLQGWSYCDLS